VSGAADDFPAPPGSRAPPVAVPHGQLSAAALRGLIEAFVLREGTDYGEREFSLEEKIAHVSAQLETGKAQIWFDPDSNSVVILRTSDGAG
jgi:uncharacterized protein